MAAERRAVIDNDAIEELVTRAVTEVDPSPADLAAELRTGRILTAYLGIDPTMPDLHVGHVSQLLKLQRLQELGHTVILLIGDFTGMIGDPTDKTAARVRLTKEQVLENAIGYREQARSILDFDDPVNPALIRYNSDWLAKLSFEDVVELASSFTVQQMLSRDMFKQRIGQGRPVGLHEFLYPLMQGFDSVAMEVDIEVGGSDQIFNMRAGSELVKARLHKRKFVIAGKLLVDPSGVKIGKTQGNMITLNDTPPEMFHRIMMWGDAITPTALELCTRIPRSEITRIERALESGELSGIEGKKFLASTLIAELHGAEAAAEAEAAYDVLAARDGASATLEQMQLQEVSPGETILDVLFGSGLAPSQSAARRLVDGRAVRVNGLTIDDYNWTVPPGSEPLVLQTGKRRIENFRRLVVADGDAPRETDRV